MKLTNLPRPSALSTPMRSTPSHGFRPNAGTAGQLDASSYEGLRPFGSNHEKAFAKSETGIFRSSL